MPTFFNNCRCREHKRLFRPPAFFDLNTTGPQSKIAIGLRRGEKCVVASYDEDRAVVFDWYTLSKESIEPNPSLPETYVRVFRGKLAKSVRLSKAKAVKTKPYSVFFNVRGDFKRPSVVT